MSTTTIQTTAVSSTPKRIILASAYRHERHSTGRQERALKTLRKMGRFDDNSALDNRCMRRITSTDDALDD
jgi:hypothetical protein